MAHLTPRGAAQWQYGTADRVGNDPVYSAESGGQPTTSKSNKDSHHRKDKDKKPRDNKGKAPAVIPAMPQAMTSPIDIPGRSSSQGQVDPTAHTATPIGRSVSTSVSSVPTSQLSSPKMSGALPQVDSRDGPSQGRVAPSDNFNLCIKPDTPGTGQTPASIPAVGKQSIVPILKPSPDPNAPPTQPSNLHITFAPNPVNDPPPNPDKNIYTKKFLRNQRKNRDREIEEEEIQSLVSGESYSGSSSSAQYGNYDRYGEDEDYQAGRYIDDDQGSGNGYHY